MSPVSIFISYAQEDEAASAAIQRHLVIKRRKKVLAFKDHHKLMFGTKERMESIGEALNQSSIILLILSDYFIASDECYEVQEMALERAQARQTILIPLLYRKCDWQQLDGISKLQPLPRNRLFIRDWPDSDNAFAEISREVGEIAQQIFDGKIQLTPSNSPVKDAPATSSDAKIPNSDPRALIAQGKIDVALQVLATQTSTDPDLSNQVVNLQAQLATLEQKVRKGIIASSEERLERNQIINAALQIAAEAFS